MKQFSKEEIYGFEMKILYLKEENKKLEADKKELTKQLALCSVSQQRELLDCPKCKKQHFISIPIVEKNTCQVCKHEWQSYCG